MADLVFGLAKSVVEGALTKAQAAIEEEARLRDSAQRDLVFITGEFQMMQSFLNVANNERVGNPVVRTWVRQVRELAYDVEDCIEFVVHLDTTSSCAWLWRMVPSCMAPPRKLDEAVDEIEQLKARVGDVSKRNARYSLISDTGSKPAEHQPPVSIASVSATASAVLAEARDAAKRQQGVRDLTQMIPKEDGDLTVISVWGSGGDHGTKSIIRKAYNDPEVCRNFTCRAWVKLTHPFDHHGFIRSFMAQFYAHTCEKQGAEKAVQVLTKMKATQDDLLKEFVQEVNKQRYLVVLENLSDMVDWDAIRTLLPDMKNGSWIVVSTQQLEIAGLCIEYSYQPLELKRFSTEHSVCALFKEGSQAGGDKGKKQELRDEAKQWRENYFPLVGREPQTKELSKYTAKAFIKNFHVMSVWGIAGVGKSAVVRNLYYHRVLESKQFNQLCWVDVSHPFNLRDFCRSLISDFHSEKDPIKECRQLLKDKRCLLVIDDLRSNQEWDIINAALVSRSSKSLIIVITTEASIANYCADSEELVFNVKGLEADAAFHLFEKVWDIQTRKLKRDIPSHEDEVTSLSLGEVPEIKEVISKCGGLPKVIVAIATLLAPKTLTWVADACSINDKFMKQLETNPEFDSLRDLFTWMHSYFRTCPDSLKPCIFYLSIFPRDEIIRRRRLVMRWVAEGYSRDNHEKSAVEEGEEFFSELLDLSIIQQIPQFVTTGFNDTMMVFCQVNGFIREYIVSRRMEENLVFELEGRCTITTQRTGRHLIIRKSWNRDKIVFESIDFSRIRSMTVFGRWESFFISKSMKLLRVLDLENATGVTDKDLKEIVKRLRRLKFLSLRGCHGIFHLPSSLGDLRQLQTLDVRHTSIVTLPANITKLQKLQYIRAGSTVLASRPPFSACWRCHRLSGVEVPRGIGKLTALHTLGEVIVGTSGHDGVLKEVKKLTQLRKLGVSGINKKNSKRFFFAISGHVHLESLSVRLDKDNQGCLDINPVPSNEDGWAYLENLRSLKLNGLGDKLPEWCNRLSNLVKLGLEVATLLENDIKFLGLRLPKLCILSIRVKQLQDAKLDFCVTANGHEQPSYQKVKILEIGCSSSLHVTFGFETMQNLELLKFDVRNGLYYRLSGLDRLSEIKEVLLQGSDETLKADLQSQLQAHPKKPVVKLEKLPHSA